MKCFEIFRAAAIAFLLGAFTSGCSGSMTSPSVSSSTQPGMTPTPAPPPSGSSVFTLKGRVTEAAPTFRSGVGGARLIVTGGSSVGISAVADSFGYYTIPSLEARSTLTVSADGYVSTTRTVNSEADSPDFQLMPVAETNSHTMHGTLSPEVGTCSDGTAMKPCNIMTIAIHNSGPLDAMLTWSSDESVNLDLSLFRMNDPTPIARSAAGDSTSERISANLPAGANYELHVTYTSGTAPTTYVLKVTHMN